MNLSNWNSAEYYLFNSTNPTQSQPPVPLTPTPVLLNLRRLCLLQCTHCIQHTQHTKTITQPTQTHQNRWNPTQGCSVPAEKKMKFNLIYFLPQHNHVFRPVPQSSMSFPSLPQTSHTFVAMDSGVGWCTRPTLIRLLRCGSNCFANHLRSWRGKAAIWAWFHMHVYKP